MDKSATRAEKPVPSSTALKTRQPMGNLCIEIPGYEYLEVELREQTAKPTRIIGCSDDPIC